MRAATVAQAAGPIPPWTFGDRMAKARHYAGLTQTEIAARIGIARQSAVNYERDRHVPLEAILRAWVEVTEVDEHWLRTGCTCQRPEACDTQTVRLTVGCSAIELRGTAGWSARYQSGPTTTLGASRWASGRTSTDHYCPQTGARGSRSLTGGGMP